MWAAYHRPWLIPWHSKPMRKMLPWLYILKSNVSLFLVFHCFSLFFKHVLSIKKKIEIRKDPKKMCTIPILKIKDICSTGYYWKFQNSLVFSFFKYNLDPIVCAEYTGRDWILFLRLKKKLCTFLCAWVYHLRVRRGSQTSRTWSYRGQCLLTTSPVRQLNLLHFQHLMGIPFSLLKIPILGS